MGPGPQSACAPQFRRALLEPRVDLGRQEARWGAAVACWGCVLAFKEERLQACGDEDATGVREHPR